MQRKIFRIEQAIGSGNPLPPVEAGDAEQRHFELLNELKSLRALTERRDESGNAGIAMLKQELELIYNAINQTKLVLSTLAGGGHEGPRVARAAYELDAIEIGRAHV